MSGWDSPGGSASRLSGQPPPGSRVYDCAVGPPPLSGAHMVARSRADVVQPDLEPVAERRAVAGTLARSPLAVIHCAPDHGSACGHDGAARSHNTRRHRTRPLASATAPSGGPSVHGPASRRRPRTTEERVPLAESPASGRARSTWHGQAGCWLPHGAGRAHRTRCRQRLAGRRHQAGSSERRRARACAGVSTGGSRSSRLTRSLSPEMTQSAVEARASAIR